MKITLHQCIPYVLYGIFILFLGGCLSACSENDPGNGDSDPNYPEEKPEATILFDEGTDLNPVFSSEGGLFIVNFTATDDWTVTIGNDRANNWLKLSAEQGKSGKASISISIEANTTNDERSASIFFSCGDIRKTIIITQKQKDALVVSQSEFEVPAEGGQVTVELKSNISFQVDINSDWIHQEESRGLETYQLTFRIDENLMEEGRTGKILISASGIQEEISIYQLAKEKQEEEVLLLSNKLVNVTANGEIIKVQLNYNREFDYYPITTYNWINEVVTRAVSTHTFYFEVQPNNTYDTREAQYVFKSKTQNLSDTLTVRQAPQGGLIVSEKQFLLDASEQTFNVIVESNIDYKISCEADWIEQINSRGLESSTVTFRVKENSGTEARKGEILFQGDGLEQLVQVVQQGIQEEPILMVSPTTIELEADAGFFNIDVQTNVKYYIQINDPWIKDITSRALSEERLSFSVEANTDTSLRTGSISIESEDGVLSQTVQVIQKGKTEEPYLTVNATQFTLDAFEQEISIEISTNEDYDLEISDNWIICKETVSGEKDIILFTVKENTSSESRSGNILIKGKNLSQSILIIQQGRPETPQLIVSPSEINVGPDASNFTLHIQSNVNYSINIDVSWIKETKLPSSSENEVSFSAEANENTSVRTGRITFQSEDGKLKQSVTVTQAAKETIGTEGTIEDFTEKEENW